MHFNPEHFYSVNRMPRRRSLLRAASRDYEVYFTDIESVVDRLRDIFNHLIKKLISEIQEDLPAHSHRIRLVVNAPTVNYPIHIPFSSMRNLCSMKMTALSTRTKHLISAKIPRWVCLACPCQRWVENRLVASKAEQFLISSFSRSKGSLSLLSKASKMSVWLTLSR